jgi:hypothetical protein
VSSAWHMANASMTNCSRSYDTIASDGEPSSSGLLALVKAPRSHPLNRPAVPSPLPQTASQVPPTQPA